MSKAIAALVVSDWKAKKAADVSSSENCGKTLQMTIRSSRIA